MLLLPPLRIQAMVFISERSWSWCHHQHPVGFRFFPSFLRNGRSQHGRTRSHPRNGRPLGAGASSASTNDRSSSEGSSRTRSVRWNELWLSPCGWQLHDVELSWFGRIYVPDEAVEKALRNGEQQCPQYLHSEILEAAGTMGEILSQLREIRVVKDQSTFMEASSAA